MWVYGAVALRLNRFRLSGVALGVLVTVGSPALARAAGNSANDTSRAATVYSLAKCVALAKANYPKIAEAKARLQQARQQQSEAYTAPFMAFKGQGGVATPSSRTGTSLYSPDDAQDLLKNNQAAWSASVSGVIPLWTFGKITNLWDAAEAQVGYKAKEVVKAQNEIELAVHEAYYGWQFAQEALALVENVIERLESHEATLVDQVEAGDADDADLYRVQLQLADILARRSEAQSQRTTAQAGLAFFVGVPATDFTISEGPLQPVLEDLASLERYKGLAQTHRPEVDMAKFGLKARRAQLGQAKAGLFPDFGLGLAVNWSYAPGITEQRNPFVADPNFLGVTIGLGVKWSLDFLPQLARIGQAEAQLGEVEATARFATQGIGVEVTKAFEAAQHAQRRVGVFTKAVRTARKWLVATQQGIAIGAYDEKDLVEPSKEYALKRFAEMNAIYEFNVAVARLALAVGNQKVVHRD